MIKITVDTKDGVQIIEEGTIVKGELKDLMFELTALQSAIVNAVVEQNKHNLQPGVSLLDAKFNMVDTMAQTTKVALESDHKYTSNTKTTVQHIKPLQEEPKEMAATKEKNNIIINGIDLDVDKITWEIYAINELVDKWWPVMNDHIMTEEEIKQLHKDAEQVGIDMDDLINAMIDRQGEMGDR